MATKYDTLIQRAKAALILDNPFIATLLCNIETVMDDTISPPTLATDGERIYVHPGWVDDHTEANLRWGLSHEVMHCVFKHFLPEEHAGLDFQKWNIAADVVINCTLENEKSVGDRPKNVIWDRHPVLGGKTAKELYEKGKHTRAVYRLLPDTDGGGGCDGGGGSGPGGGAWDNVKRHPGDPSKREEAAARWSVRVSQAAAAAKMQGQLSAEMERFIGEVLKPKVNWQEQLRHFCTKAAAVHRSWARPNRRFLGRGIYLPGRGGRAMGDIVIAVDLSGSVGQRELNAFAAEMNAIKQDVNPSTLHVLYFASSVLRHDEFEADEELVIRPTGTGGTAFSPIFKFVDDHDLNPMCTVVLTDLRCSDFGPPPAYPVMWCSTHADKAPWGEVILIKD